jgi:1,2-diacylglycerol-3-alpha-glucose alpha-1,2-glucosyltransferase
MKVYLYSQLQKLIEKSGVGRAYYHQKKALSTQKIICVDNKEAADVIHINTIFPGSVFMARWGKRHGKKVIFHAHSTKEDFRNSYIGSNLFAGLFGRWITFCYQMGDCIITPTPYSKRLLQSYGIKNPIYALSNGIDLGYYKKTTEEGQEFRRRYGYDKTDKVIISVGLWIERKGILDFIQLAKRMPEYQFIWFGESNLRTVPKKIRTAMKQKPSNLIFAGYVDREHLRQAYAGADLFLFPSQEETEGIVILEALAMKLPVLVRKIPVYEDWLVDGENVYKAATQAEFISKTRALLNKKLSDTTQKGYQTAEERSITEIGKKLVSIYSS